MECAASPDILVVDLGSRGYSAKEGYGEYGYTEFDPDPDSDSDFN